MLVSITLMDGKTVSLSDLDPACDESGPISLCEGCIQDTSTMKKQKPGLLLKTSRNHFALVHKLWWTDFAEETTPLLIYQRTSKPLLNHYENARWNPGIERTSFLIVHHSLAESKGCLMDTGITYLCKKIGENVVWSISRCLEYIQENSAYIPFINARRSRAVRYLAPIVKLSVFGQWATQSWFYLASGTLLRKIDNKCIRSLVSHRISLGGLSKYSLVKLTESSSYFPEQFYYKHIIVSHVLLKQ